MRNRSPNYPAVGLPEALEQIKTLYGEAHRRKLSRAEIARLLGYGSLNGTSITLISALLKYGLLEGRGEEIRVSDDAIAILVEEPGASDRRAALRRVALKPELFSELMEGMPSPPGENAVRIRLEKKHFTAKAAQAAARAFRETMALVEAEVGDYNELQVAEEERDRGGSMQVQPTVAAPVVQQAVLAAPAQGFKQDVFTLSEGDVVLRWPEGLSKESFPDLLDWLEVMQRKIARAIGAEFKTRAKD